MKKPAHNKLLRSMLIAGAMLSLFGAIGTAMVAAVYQGTKDKIADNIQQKLLDNLNTVIPVNSYSNDLINTTLPVTDEPLLGNKGLTTIYQAIKEQQVNALAFKITAPDGYSGAIQLLIGIKSDGTISGVRTISHKETPGLGDKIEIERSDWITLFNHKSLKDPEEKKWKVKKDGGDFDQLTGATITPRAIIRAVHRALKFVELNKLWLFSLPGSEIKNAENGAQNND